MVTTTANQSTHYVYPLVTWRATLMGAVVALVTSLMLNLLGASLGIAALIFAPAAPGSVGTDIIGVAWVVISNLVALGFGAWMAGRTTANPDHHGGTLQGIAVWAVTSLAVLYIAGASLSGAAMQAATLAAQAGRPAADATTPSSQDVQRQTQEATAAVQQNAAAIQNAALQVSRATAAATFSLFLAMALGLVAAITGARLGARHPGWSDRPRFTTVEHRHTA